jgi:MFS family permease
MIRSLAPVWALLLSTAILLVSSGLMGTLLPLRGGLEGFRTAEIALFGFGYYGGFVLGCLLCPYVVRQAGHIRAFVVFASGASAAPLIHAIAVEPSVWVLLRAVTGFCFAGIHMIIESWLNARATNQTRGGIMSAYTMVNLTAMIGGQALLIVAPAEQFTLFAIASLLLSLALMPVALTSAVQPPPVTAVTLRVARLFRLSPASLVGAFTVGIANGVFWALGPVYALEIGFTSQTIAAFVSAFILGGAIGQWPLGRLSDRIDRRYVIMAGLLIAALAEIGLFAVAAFDFGGVAASLAFKLTLAFLLGTFALPIYAVCAAHLNDVVASDEFLEAVGGLLLIFGLGAAIGPLLASGIATVHGVATVFALTAAVRLLAGAYVFYRKFQTEVPDEAKEDFIPAPRTTPVAYELDPRTATENEETAAAAGPDWLRPDGEPAGERG